MFGSADSQILGLKIIQIIVNQLIFLNDSVNTSKGYLC